jgi:hypothetical protein
MGVSGTTVTIYNSGYQIYVNLDGTFSPSQIWWNTGTGCSGTGYLNDGQSGAGGVGTYSKTLVWSGATNQWYVTTGTVSNDIIYSAIESGGSAVNEPGSPSNGYGPYVTYFAAGDYSFEGGGNSDGSYSCDIHQDYGENYNNGTEGSPHLVTTSAPLVDNYGTFSLDYGLGFSGWQLESFNPQSTLGWPSFSSCTVTVYGGSNGENPGATPPANTTTTNSCLAAPLQLP